MGVGGANARIREFIDRCDFGPGRSLAEQLRQFGHEDAPAYSHAAAIAATYAAWVGDASDLLYVSARADELPDPDHAGEVRIVAVTTTAILSGSFILLVDPKLPPYGGVTVSPLRNVEQVFVHSVAPSAAGDDVWPTAFELSIVIRGRENIDLPLDLRAPGSSVESLFRALLA